MSMSARKAMNKNHPQYAEYKARFEALMQEALKEHERWENENQSFSGLDGEPVRIDRRLSQRIKKLQSEYGYLFKEV